MIASENNQQGFNNCGEVHEEFRSIFHVSVRWSRTAAVDSRLLKTFLSALELLLSHM